MRQKKKPQQTITFLDLQGNITEPAPGMTVTIDHATDQHRRYNVYRDPDGSDRHSRIECLATHREEDGRILRCNWSQRIKRVTLNNTYGTHVCNYTVATSMHKFVTSVSDPTARLSDQLAYTAGKLNLSLEGAISEEMQQLLSYSYTLGQEHPNSAFDKVAKWPTRYDVRRSMIRVALEETEETVKDFRHSAFLSVAIDEGSTLHIKYVHFILHDVHRTMSEYCISSQILQGTGTAENYVDALQNGFLEMASHEISIGSVVVDGGTAQLKALGNQPGMLRSKLPKRGPLGKLRHYIVFPCACHKLNNCYKTACQNLKPLSDFVTEVRSIAESLRSPTSGVRCPQFISTRWLYDASIIKFLEENREALHECLHDKNLDDLYANIDNWKPMIYMMRSMVDQLESANAPSADVWPRIYTLASDLRKEAKEHDRPIKQCYEELARNLESQILMNGAYTIAFLLTPIGRDWARYPRQWRAKPAINTYTFNEKPRTNLDDLEDAPQLLDELVDPDRVLALLVPEEEASSTDESTNRRSVPVLAMDTSDSDESDERVELQDADSGIIVDPSPNVHPNDSTNENDRRPLDESETTDGAEPELVRGQWVTAALREWKSMAETVFGDVVQTKGKKSSRTPSMGRVDRAVSQLNTYLSTATGTAYEGSLSQIQDLNLWNWEVLIDDRRFSEIAELALRIRPTPASEASAERYISLQRLVVLARRNRANKDLTDARMALLKRAHKSRGGYIPLDVKECRERIDRGTFVVPRK